MKIADRQAKEREPLRLKQRLKQAIEHQRNRRTQIPTSPPPTKTITKERITNLKRTQG